MMYSGSGGGDFSHSHELDNPETLTTRLRRRVRAKRGHHEISVSKRPVGISAVLLLLTMLLLFAGLCFAQSTFGSVRGTVQDCSGLVILEESVTIHSLAENADRTDVTDSSGNFNSENLKPGLYTITVHHQGFSDAVVSSTALSARHQLRVPFTLKVASHSSVVGAPASAIASIRKTPLSPMRKTMFRLPSSLSTIVQPQRASAELSFSHTIFSRIAKAI
jgi:hypothetical protein